MPKIPQNKKVCSVPDCGKPLEKIGLCGMHYRRKWKHGTLELKPIIRPPVETRIFEKTNKNGPLHPVLKTNCWVWFGCQSGRGYGVMSVNDKQSYVHRIVYEMYRGEIEDGLQVCHHCDNPSCVNPEHLFIGTIGDNMDDKVSKNRQLKGEGVGNSKLTEKDVLAIRSKYVKGDPKYSTLALAKEFNVCFQTISLIANRKTWKHI